MERVKVMVVSWFDEEWVDQREEDGFVMKLSFLSVQL